MTTQSQVIVPEIVTAIPATESVNIVTPVMAEFPHFDVSSRYIHCNTMEVVDAVRDCGWEVARTACARVRRPDRQGFQKHFVWLRQPRQKMEVGDCELQLLMVNSHDGTSSLQLMAGLFRLVCLNGMTVNAGQFAAIRIRHTTEDIREQTIEGATKIAALAPALDANIKTMQNIELTPEQQADFARKTVKLVWPDHSEDWIDPNELLRTRRVADQGADLWRTFNVVQENIVRGGLPVHSDSRFKHTRAIKSAIRDVDVNVALFDLALAYAKR